MDISSDFFVDMFLNLVGYLAAGALGVVVYPTLAQWLKRHLVVVAPLPVTLAPAKAKKPASSAAQFLRLGSPSIETRSAPGAVAAEAPRTTAADRRNRVDIIRIAREMVKAGADNKRIQQVLPVSEAELALLNFQNN